MELKVAVVTGANKSLGFSIVKGLCQKFKGIVYLTARDKTRGLQAVQKLNKLGLKPVFHELDITNCDSVKLFANFLKANHNGLDVLVNNEAILQQDTNYPTYEEAKRSIDTNYKSLLTIEKFLYPLLRDGARVVNISSACGHLANLKSTKWIKALMDADLITEKINEFVDEYLKSVKNGTFNKNDFSDDGKHADYKVSKIALTALTKVQQTKYMDRNISINAVYPGCKTEISNGGGEIEADEAAKVVLYLILDASPKLKGAFMWHNKKLIDWYDAATDFSKLP